MDPVPIAFPPALPSELLNYIINYQAFPITLIICQSRSAFLSSLLNAVTNPPAVPSSHSSQPETPSALNESPELPKRHPLLIPTLRQVAASRHITLVFINTVSHLRAYLATYLPETEQLPPEENINGSKNGPLLVVYGLVELHRDTSEWSAQGLGNSVAALVEAGWEQRVVVLERREEGEEEEEQKWWDERLPMLNGSARRVGVEGEDAVWSGRTVEVARILGRWFTFEERDWGS